MLIYLSLISLHSQKNDSRNTASFLAGRAAASDALKNLSITAEVGKNKDGLPDWPSDVCGSISHTEDQAVAIVGFKQHYLCLGIDIEQDFLKAQKVFRRTGTLQEQELYKTFHETSEHSEKKQFPSDLFPLFIFSAKESFFKAFNSHIPFPLHFNDISLSIPEPIFEEDISFSNEISPHFRGSAKLTASERLNPLLQGVHIKVDILLINSHTIITIISAKKSEL